MLQKKYPPTYRFFCTPTLCLHPFCCSINRARYRPNLHVVSETRMDLFQNPGRSWPRCDKKVTLLKVQAVCEGIFTFRVSGVSCFVFLLRRYIPFHKVDVGAPGEISRTKNCLSGFFACWSTHSADCDLTC